MPTATDALRSKMDGYFSNGGINDWEPFAFLLDRGWTEKGGMLFHPRDREPSEQEWDCAQFLCDEWDYGVEKYVISDEK